MSTITSAPVLPGTRTSSKHLQGTYTLPDGSVRHIYGQRVLGHVRFLPGKNVVLESMQSVHEDSNCCPRERGAMGERADAPRPKRPSGVEWSPGADSGARRRGAVGERVELGRYRISSGERVLVGQRVNGVVRVVDVPVAPAGRAFLVERGLEEDGLNALAALEALVVDYLQQAAILDDVPIATLPI